MHMICANCYMKSSGLLADPVHVQSQISDMVVLFYRVRTLILVIFLILIFLRKIELANASALCWTKPIPVLMKMSGHHVFTKCMLSEPGLILRIYIQRGQKMKILAAVE